MATADSRLGWGLRVAPGPCSALPASQSSSLKPALKCHRHLLLAKAWWGAVIPEKGQILPKVGKIL